MSWDDDSGIGNALQFTGGATAPWETDNSGLDQAYIDIAKSALPTTGVEPAVSGVDQAMIDLAGSSLPTTGTDQTFDFSKLLKSLKGQLGGILTGAQNNPLGGIAGLLLLSQLLNKSSRTPTIGGYKGPGINMGLTATRQPVQQPEYKPYSGQAVMGRQMTGPVTYAATGKYLRGDTDGMADKLDTTIDDTQPAKLSHGEFVVPADVVSHLGNGNSDAGAKVLYGMMDRVRKARTGTTKQGKKINPNKFTPGGIAGYADGGAVAFVGGGDIKGFDGTTGSQVGPAVTTATPGGTTTEQNLAAWAGPYVTDYLSKAQALANMPYQAYQGPLVAGTSPLQQQAFGGLSALVGGGGYGGYGGYGQFMPNMQTPPRMQALSAGQGDADQAQAAPPPVGGLGTFGGMGGYGAYGGAPSSPWQFGLASNLAAQTGGLSFTQPGVSQAYMSPYMQNVVDIQQQQAQRQADIANQAQKAQFAQAGAFGGGRFGIQQAQAAADLARQKQNIQAQGLQSAFQQGQQQFNAEQQARLAAAQGLGTLGAGQFGTQLQGLQALLGAGQTQYGQEQAGITALQNEYNKQMMWPYQQLQFQQSMLQGLPVAAQGTTPNVSPYQDMLNVLNALYGIGSTVQSGTLPGTKP